MTQLADVVLMYDADDNHVVGTYVDDIFDAEWERRLSRVGTFKFSIFNDDPKCPLLKVVGKRIVFRHSSLPYILFSGHIEDWETVEVEVDEEVVLATTFSGSDDLGLLRQVKMRPWQNFSNGDPTALARRPTTTERRFGWTDPPYINIMYDADTLTYRTPGWDGQTWTPAIELFQAHSQSAPPTGRNGNPQGFPDPLAYHIWSRGLVDNQHPQGDVYFEHYFSIPPDAKGLVFYMAGDDAFDVAFQGEHLAAVDNNEADDAFMRTTRAIVRKTGAELGSLGFIRVRCRNQGPNIAGDIGSFVMTVRALGSSTTLTHTDGNWRALDYPGTGILPGYPAGYIPLRLREEAIVRAASDSYPISLSWIEFNFTYQLDSNGVAWPLITDLPITHGASTLDVLEKMTDWTEFSYTPHVGPAKIKLYSAKDIALIGGGTGNGKDAAPAVAIIPGTNCEQLFERVSTVGGEEDVFANLVNFKWKSGWGEVRNQPVIDEVGAYETFISLGDIKEESTAREIAQRKLLITSTPPTTFTTQVITDVLRPGIDFDVGDTLPVRFNGTVDNDGTYTGYSTANLRVQAIMSTLSEDGFWEASIEIGSAREVQDAKFERWLNNISRGTDFLQGSPSAPEAFTDELIEWHGIEFNGSAEEAENPESTRGTTNSAGRIGMMELRLATPGTTDSELQVYVNDVPCESVVVPAGQFYAYAYWTAGTSFPVGAVVHCAMAQWGTGMTLPSGKVHFYEVV